MATDSMCYKALFKRTEETGELLEVSVEVSSPRCPLKAWRRHVGTPTDVEWTVGRENGKGANRDYIAHWVLHGMYS